MSKAVRRKDNCTLNVRAQDIVALSSPLMAEEYTPDEAGTVSRTRRVRVSFDEDRCAVLVTPVPAVLFRIQLFV